MEEPVIPDAPPTIEPCRHMAAWVSALADGSLRGIPRLYTRFHISGCPRCQAALKALTALRDRLLRLGRVSDPPTDDLTPARRAALEASLDAIDRRDTVEGGDATCGDMQ